MTVPFIPGEDLTPQQLQENAAHAKILIPGKRYEFGPFVTAMGYPMPNLPKTIQPEIFNFTKGQYIEYKDGKHIFQGFPDKDTRKINEKHRLCFYHVLFVGGASVKPMDDTPQA